MPGMATAGDAAKKPDPLQFKWQTGRDEQAKKNFKAGDVEIKEKRRLERKALLAEFHGHSHREKKLAFNPVNRNVPGLGGDETPESIKDFLQDADEGEHLTSGQQINKAIAAERQRKANQMKLTLLRWEDNEELSQLIIHPRATVRDLHERIIKTLGYSDATRGPIRLIRNKATVFINDNTLQELGIRHKDIIHIARARRRCLVLSASSDGTVKIWSARSFRCLQTFRHQCCVNSASLSPDGTLAITAAVDGVVRVWSAETGEKVASLRGHVLSATCAALGPANMFAATASEDGTAMLWKLSTGKVVHVLGGHSEGVTCIVISPECDMVATSSKDRMALVWSTETGNCLAKLVGHDDHVLNVAFSPDATSVITGSNDRTARVWNVKNGSCRAVLGGHDAFLCEADFAENGNLAFTATYKGTVRIWALGGHHKGGNELVRVWKGGTNIVGAYFVGRKVYIIVEERRRESHAIGGSILKVHTPDDDDPPMTLPGHNGSVTFARMIMVDLNPS